MRLERRRAWYGCLSGLTVWCEEHLVARAVLAYAILREILILQGPGGLCGGRGV